MPNDNFTDHSRIVGLQNGTSFMSPFWLADIAKNVQPPALGCPRFLRSALRDLPDAFQDDFSIYYNLFLPTGLHLIIENVVKYTTRRPCASIPLDHIMNQLDTVHTLPNQYLDKHFNIILQFTPRSLKWYSSCGFLQQNLVFIHIL